MVNYFDLFLDYEWFLWLLKFYLLFHILLLLFYSYYGTKGPLHLIFYIPQWYIPYHCGIVDIFWIRGGLVISEYVSESYILDKTSVVDLGLT